MFFSKKNRLRFAPSPTGFLHIGNLRSALFSYLLAKNLKGKIILRIEDTDQKREVGGAIEKLLNIMSWVGIKFDEGPNINGRYGPYVQSQRKKIYKKLSDKLLREEKAYRCFCSPERLEEMRQEQEKNKQAPKYDGQCRHLSPEEIEEKIKEGKKFVIRQKMPNKGNVIVRDELRGEIEFSADNLDDQVLIKSNGMPTYQFANVVDDHLMKISHVTRGDEWLPSFPKNILLYKAFNWTPPKFIHLPLILNKGGGKLSKRQGDVFVEDYRQKGYLPEAIINFSVLLGWHPKDEQELFSLEDLEKIFNIDGLGTSPAIFDLEKLDYYNAHYIRQKTDEELLELCKPYFQEKNIPINNEEELSRYISLAKDRMKKLEDVVELTSFLFKLPNYTQDLLQWKNLELQDIKTNLEELKVQLLDVKDHNWKKEYLEKHIISWIKGNNNKNGDYLWPLRVALSGLKNSPSPFEIAWAIGKKETLERIKLAIGLI